VQGGELNPRLFSEDRSDGALFFGNYYLMDYELMGGDARDAIVADVPGLTRDRQYGYGRLGPIPYVVIDTGGLVENHTGIEAQMREQTERAAQRRHDALTRQWQGANAFAERPRHRIADRRRGGAQRRFAQPVSSTPLTLPPTTPV